LSLRFSTPVVIPGAIDAGKSVGAFRIQSPPFGTNPRFIPEREEGQECA